MSSLFSSNSEASASELLEYREDMFLRYWLMYTFINISRPERVNDAIEL